MTGREYSLKAMRTNDGLETDRLLSAVHRLSNEYDIELGDCLAACLGLSGEVGEFSDMIKKVIFHEAELNVEHAKKELGDIMWYVALMCYSFNWDLDDIMQTNIEKLLERYPNGFDVYRANHRKEGDV